MMKAFLVSLLILAYLSTLSMSTGHLAQWYALSLGGLPPWLAWGLAGSLEFTAFLLSLLSNSLLRGSAWAGGGALAALALVWLGNALSMHRAAPGVALWETLAMSLFVPVGTYVVGKVVGEMVAVQPTAESRREDLPAVRLEPERRSPPVQAFVQPSGVGVQASGGFVQAVREKAEQEEGSRSASAVRYRERQVERERTLEVDLDERGLAIVNALRSAGGALSLSELSRRTGIPKSTLAGKLNGLAEAGLVVRTEQGWTLNGEGRYA
jgi:predicted transcriptional regulator